LFLNTKTNEKCFFDIIVFDHRVFVRNSMH